MADNQVIYDLLQEVRNDQKEHIKKQAEQSEEIAKQRICLANVEQDIKKIQEDVAENKDDWREHMRKTVALENLHADNLRRIAELESEFKKKEDRIKKLEKPAIGKAWLKENLSWILVTASLIAGLGSKIAGWW